VYLKRGYLKKLGKMSIIQKIAEIEAEVRFSAGLYVRILVSCKVAIE